MFDHLLRTLLVDAQLYELLLALSLVSLSVVLDVLHGMRREAMTPSASIGS